jgi:hypothetical protein
LSNFQKRGHWLQDGVYWITRDELVKINFAMIFFQTDQPHLSGPL